MRCFRKEPKPKDFDVDPATVDKLRSLSIPVLAAAITHPNIGAGTGASVYLPTGEMPKGQAMNCLSYLEAKDAWEAERRNCLLLLATGATALFTCVIAIAAVWS